jgi:DNA-binding NtrC family response regulator
MPPDLQVKFLRVLDTRAFRRVGGNEELDVDVRLVASSNRDLTEAVKNGSFRSDLFYRLNVFPLWMPPLRLRKEDIPALASHFLSQVEEKELRRFTALEDGALEALARYDWPGNVRELKNAVHRAYVLSDPPTVPREVVEAVLNAPQAGESSPAADANSGAWPAVPVRVGERLDAVERKLLIATLQAVNGDRRAAAEMLGISLKTVYNRLKEYGIDHGSLPGGRTRGA